MLPPAELDVLRSRLDRTQQIGVLLEGYLGLAARVKRDADEFVQWIAGQQNRIVAEAKKGGFAGEVMQILLRNHVRAIGFGKRAGLIRRAIRVLQHKVSDSAERLIEQRKDTAVDARLKRAIAAAAMLRSVLDSQYSELAAIRAEIEAIVSARPPEGLPPASL